VAIAFWFGMTVVTTVEVAAAVTTTAVGAVAPAVVRWNLIVVGRREIL
jgi:hypothetical protein